MTDKTAIILEGQAARELVENPAFKRAMEDVKRGISEAMMLTAPADTAKREYLYSIYHALPLVEGALVVAVNGGARAVAERFAEQARQERKEKASTRPRRARKSAT